MKRLIVALDLSVGTADDYDAAIRLTERLRRVGVSWFKIGTGTAIQSYGWCLVKSFSAVGDHLMLDLKVWDTPDTVERTVAEALRLGAEYVTVRAEPAVVDAALCVAAAYPAALVLPVGQLSSSSQADAAAAARSDDLIRRCGAGVVPAWDLERCRRACPDAVLVTPGIRRADDQADDHVSSVGCGITSPG